jgi:hypothetical protein
MMDEDTTIEIHVIVEDLGLKNEGKAARALQSINKWDLSC